MRLVELVGTLSLATDAGTGMPDETGLRMATAAAKIGELLDASLEDRTNAFYLALLRFLGCTADSNAPADALGDEVEFARAMQGLDFWDGKEMFGAAMRFARKDKGLVGGALAMARAFAKFVAVPCFLSRHTLVDQRLPSTVANTGVLPHGCVAGTA